MVEFKYSTYILQENNIIDGEVIDSGELVSNGRYFSPYIAYSIWYVNPRDGNIETIISLRTVIQSDISMSRIKLTL